MTLLLILSDPLAGIAFVLKGNDTVIGANVVGIDHLRASGGNDTIQGRLGKDIVDGGTGVDTAVYSEKTVGIALTLKDGALIASQYTGVTGVLGGNAVISPAKLEDYRQQYRERHRRQRRRLPRRQCGWQISSPATPATIR